MASQLRMISKNYTAYITTSKPGGEVYFIEFKPIGCTDYLPIVIGDKKFRGQGIGKKVVLSLIERAKQLGFSYLEVAEIYDDNAGSRKLFESADSVLWKSQKKDTDFKNRYAILLRIPANLLRSIHFANFYLNLPLILFQIFINLRNIYGQTKHQDGLQPQ